MHHIIEEALDIRSRVDLIKIEILAPTGVKLIKSFTLGISLTSWNGFYLTEFQALTSHYWNSYSVGSGIKM